ncbi:hypothetical protein ARALYDRAFT_907119 [Arabidopsis lyrata subsp. lyrata]|uniref:Thioester reductase (TE) domain-containing protein n=1 Tax=Arabidopsis lyrata subsp. lyrata TaxID=81972 RepID=D7LVI9_ARALL|nr:hypothetical protein ARALYDRAFT_907119 [Arabidopsis lyrata subsp. lyrata]
MRSRDQESANKRLYDELLKQMHGSSYEAFTKSQLDPVIGDIVEDNLGIESESTVLVSYSTVLVSYI